MKLDIIHTDAAPRASNVYSQAIKAGDLIFYSGQIALDANTGQMVGHDAVTQAQQIFQNLDALLEAAGSDREHVVKVQIFLQDLDDYADINTIYGEYFSDYKPARDCIEVAKLPLGALVEISVIAVQTN